MAINPFDSCEVMGGTQDNGTWSNTNNCTRDTFNQVIYGDGGNAVYDATQPDLACERVHERCGDSNFRNGDPERWVVSTAPIRRSGEGPAFYWPQVGDPNPTPGTHPIYSGARHVWRTLAFGGGTARHRPAAHDPEHRHHGGELSGVRHRRHAVRLWRLPADGRAVLRRVGAHPDPPVVHQPAGRPSRDVLR